MGAAENMLTVPDQGGPERWRGPSAED